jgi:predicted transcriptional regulator
LNRPDFSQDQIQQVKYLYKLGYSTRIVASKVGMSKSYVHYLCKRLPKPELKLTKKNFSILECCERTSRLRARKILENKLGRKLSSKEHTHHIDENPFNNHPSNLIVMNESEHHSHHSRGPEYEIPREKRPSRIAWKKIYDKEYRMGLRRNE